MADSKKPGCQADSFLESALHDRAGSEHNALLHAQYSKP